MHFRRVLPVLRPVVVITPNPDGGRSRKGGSVSALTTRPSRAEADEAPVLWSLCASRLADVRTLARVSRAHHESGFLPHEGSRRRPN